MVCLLCAYVAGIRSILLFGVLLYVGCAGGVHSVRGVALQTSVIEMATMLRNLSQGSSHAAAALEGLRVHELHGAAVPPLPASAPGERAGLSASFSVPPAQGSSISFVQRVPPSSSTDLPQRVVTTAPPLAATRTSSGSHITPVTGQQMPPSTPSAPGQLPAAATVTLPAPVATAVPPQTQSQAPALPAHVANVLGSVLGGVQSMQSGNIAQVSSGEWSVFASPNLTRLGSQGLAGILSTAMQHLPQNQAPQPFSSLAHRPPASPASTAPVASSPHSTNAPEREAGAVGSHTTTGSTTPSTGGVSSHTLPSRADIGDIDWEEFDAGNMLAPISPVVATPSAAPSTGQNTIHVTQSSVVGDLTASDSIDDILDSVSVDDLDVGDQYVSDT